MDENSKKRSRKSKLVPRECLDSDDENIAVMQKEIEETLIQIKNKSILKRLSNPPQPKPLEFSVKIEVEEIDEVADAVPDLNIKINSVKSLCDPSSPAATIKKVPNVAHYIIDHDVIRNEFDKLSQETMSEADKRIEINLLNYFGKKKILSYMNPVDEKLQNIFRKKWRNFRFSFPSIRDVPLMYKCYVCNLAWWYLYDFREHVLQHQSVFIDLETNCHECNVIAYQGPVPAMKGIWIDSKCWKCSKTVVAHVFLGNIKTTGYRCSGCKEKFYTCRLLKEHESNCLFYRDSLKLADEVITMTFVCNLCPIKAMSDEDMQEHMILSHSVRCDIPVDWHLKTCGKCEIPYHLQALHDCPYKAPTTSCEFCLQKFKSHLFVLIHLNSIEHYYPCKICGKQLRKQCMELEHLIEHTDNYVALYRCIYCPDSILFPDLDLVYEHNNNSHKQQLKNIGRCYEMVVVPKRLIEKTQLIKPMETVKSQKTLPPVVEKNFNTACQGLLGFLDERLSKDEETNTIMTATINCDVNAEKSIIENSDHLDLNLLGTGENKKDIESVKTNSGNSLDLDKNNESKITNSESSHDLDTNSITEKTNPENLHDLDKSSVNEKTNPENSLNLDKNRENEKIIPDNLHELDKNSVGTSDNQKDSELKKTNTEPKISCKVNIFSQERINKIGRLVKPYCRPEKPKKEKKISCKPKCWIRNKVIIDLKMPEKTQQNNKEQSTAKDSQISDKTQSNSQPQKILSDDLVIKKEKPDDYEVTDIIQEQQLEFHEIELEREMSIKQEIHIGIPEHNINKNKTANKEHTQCNELNNVNIQTVIKEETVFGEYSNELEIMNIYEKDNQQMDFPMKKEVFSANDLIILDPIQSGSSQYSDVDPSANDASMAIDDIDMQALEPEVIVYHSYGKKKYRCNKCGFEGYHCAYKEHFKGDKHIKAQSKRQHCCKPPKADEESVHRYTCTKCKEVYQTFYKYTLHFSKVHEYKALTCPQCMRQSMNSQCFQSHMHTHIRDSFVTIYLIKNKGNEDENRHQCKKCSVKVSAADFFEHWESHLEIAKDNQTLKGYIPEMENKPDLKRMLILLQGLDSHPNRGSANKLRDCHTCQRRFERKNECKRHFIEHLLADAFQERRDHGFLKCQICGQGFYTSERYKRHMRDHASLPLYICEICDKAFSDSSNFTKHKKVHNLSVLICDICNKKFTGKIYIEKHMLMHQRIQPKVCQECNRVFYSESSYRKHMKRGQIRVKCNSCEIVFNCLKEKWDHMWEVHKERKFQADCPLCDKPFRKHQDVRKHIRHDHADYNFKYVPNKTPLKERGPDQLVVMYMNGSLASDKS